MKLKGDVIDNLLLSGFICDSQLRTGTRGQNYHKPHLEKLLSVTVKGDDGVVYETTSVLSIKYQINLHGGRIRVASVIHQDVDGFRLGGSNLIRTCFPDHPLSVFELRMRGQWKMMFVPDEI